MQCWKRLLQCREKTREIKNRGLTGNLFNLRIARIHTVYSAMICLFICRTCKAFSCNVGELRVFVAVYQFTENCREFIRRASKFSSVKEMEKRYNSAGILHFSHESEFSLSQSPLCSPKIWKTFTSNCLTSHVGEHCRKFASCRTMNAWDDTERSISPKGRDEEEIEEESKRGGTPVLRLCVSGAWRIVI